VLIICYTSRPGLGGAFADSRAFAPKKLSSTTLLDPKVYTKANSWLSVGEVEVDLRHVNHSGHGDAAGEDSQMVRKKICAFDGIQLAAGFDVAGR